MAHYFFKKYNLKNVSQFSNHLSSLIYVKCVRVHFKMLNNERTNEILTHLLTQDDVLES